MQAYSYCFKLVLKVTLMCGSDHSSCKWSSGTTQPLRFNVRPGDLLPEPCLLLCLRTGRFAEQMHTRTAFRALLSLSKFYFCSLKLQWFVCQCTTMRFLPKLSPTQCSRLADLLGIIIYVPGFLVSGIISISLSQCVHQYRTMFYWVA